MFTSAVIPKRLIDSSNREWWDDTIKKGYGYFQYFIHIDDVGNLSSENIWDNSFSVEESVMDIDTVKLGCANIGQCSFVINNIYGDFSNIDFLDKRIKVFITLCGKDYSITDYGYADFYDAFNQTYITNFKNYRETLFMGEFIIKSAKRNDYTISIVAYNLFSLLDEPCSKDVIINEGYGNTLDYFIINQVLDYYGIQHYYLYPYDTDHLDEDEYDYITDGTTYRQLFQFIGEKYGFWYIFEHLCDSSDNTSPLENRCYDKVRLFTLKSTNDNLQNQYYSYYPYKVYNVSQIGVYDKDIYQQRKSIRSFKENITFTESEALFGEGQNPVIDAYPPGAFNPSLTFLIGSTGIKETIPKDNKIHVFSLGSERDTPYANRVGLEILIKDNPLLMARSAYEYMNNTFNSLSSFYFQQCSFTHTSNPKYMAPFTLQYNNTNYSIMKSVFSSSSPQRSYGAGSSNNSNLRMTTTMNKNYNVESNSYVKIKKTTEENWGSIYNRIIGVDVGGMSLMSFSSGAASTLTNGKITNTFNCVCVRVSSTTFDFFGDVGGWTIGLVRITNATSSNFTLTRCKQTTLSDF